MNIQSLNSPSTGPSSPRTSVTDTTATSSKKDTVVVEPQKTQQPTANVKVDGEQLKAAVKAANDFIQPFNGNLQFSIDKESGTTIVKVIDTVTKEVIKQFPSEEMLAIAKGLDQMTGLLVKQKV